MLGETIAHYRILEQLGQGGMGQVYLAEDLRLERRVALKFLPPGVGRDRSARARFLREAKAASSLDHPNICTVHAIDETDDGVIFIVMARYEGETLQDRIERGALAMGEAAEIALQIARGLSKAHALGIVHRDIKPANIFLTDDGLVKILDFGVAKMADLTQVTQEGAAIGTPAYMSPEQLRGEAVDRRSDLWSLGVVLYEMLCGAHPFRRDEGPPSPHAILHSTPVPLAERCPDLDSGIVTLVTRCLQPEILDRPSTADELVAGLEALATPPSTRTQREKTREARLRSEETGRRPYPGLKSFGEEDAEYFHGREAQIDSAWEKLGGSYLLAIIGPSGTGKTSFLQAGLMAQRPSGWGVLRCTPAGSPSLSLRECLIPALAKDTVAIKDLLRQQDDDATIDAVRRWRNQHTEALLIVDQFEELFTLSPPDEQIRFSQLLSRLSLEANVHVLLSLRDDFFARCQEQPALSPIFESPTVLAPLNEAALRSAMREPARDCGYEFEDEELIEQVLRDVEGERGTLPLIAFAMSQLWDRRDQEKGLLTRDAYREIGGVEGALARHAESVLKDIGPAGAPIVREIFRNLVTSEGTRSVRERMDLLSVFDADARGDAESVLDALATARLLTTYETRDDEGLPHQRVEIVHESLLGAWPRLVRWQAQDAEGALLRDQLRQAARTWEERGRSADLLWTGDAYGEFAVWRARYPGGLTDREEAYARAMERREAAQRRRRRLAAVTIVAAALAIAAVMTVFWQQAETERDRAEAARLLALGRLELDDYPTGALAYAMASLELADTEEARLFALRALWLGPPENIVPIGPTHTPNLHFTPHGEFLAVTGLKDSVYVMASDGSFRPTIAKQPMDTVNHTELVDDGGLLVVGASGEERVELFSFPEGELLRTIELAGRGTFRTSGTELLTITRETEGDGSVKTVRRWPLAGDGGGESLGRFQGEDWELHPSGKWFGVRRGDELWKSTISPAAVAQDEYLLDLPAKRSEFYFVPDDDRIVVTSAEGWRPWSPETGWEDPRAVPGGEKAAESYSGFPSGGSQFVGASENRSEIHLWDLELPSQVEPRVLRFRSESGLDAGMAFTPSGDWLVTIGRHLSFWPVAQRRVRVVPGHNMMIAFNPDSSWLGTAGLGGEGACLLPLSAHTGRKQKPLVEQAMGGFAQGVAALPGGEGFLFGRYDGGVWRVRMEGGEPQLVEHRPKTTATAIAIDAEGNRVALGYSGKGGVRVFDLETLEKIAELPDLGPVQWNGLGFSRRGVLYGAENGVIKRWDLEAGTSEILAGTEGKLSALFMNTNRRSMIAFVGVLEPDQSYSGEFLLFDLEAGTRREFEPFLPNPFWICFSEDVLAMTNHDDTIWVGRVGDEDYHALIGQAGAVNRIAISPDHRWIASTGGNELRLWPMPDLDEPPLHALPLAELLDDLESLTNVRVVSSRTTPGGYELDTVPFQGWRTTPTW